MNSFCKEISEDILKGGQEREKAAKKLYLKYKDILWQMIRKWSGIPKEEVKDCYTDAIIALIHRIESQNLDFTKKGACESFLRRVMHNKCYDVWRKIKEKKFEYIEASENTLITNPFHSDYDKDLLKACYNKLGEKCQAVLKDWTHGYNMKEIAEMNELSNANVAAVTRSKCMKQLIELLKNAGMEGLK